MKVFMGLIFNMAAFALWADGMTNINWSGLYVGGNLGGIWSQFQGASLRPTTLARGKGVDALSKKTPYILSHGS